MLGALAALLVPALLLAQDTARVEAAPTITADVGLLGAYVWRGVTSTNRFVVQPDLSLAFPLGRSGRTAVSVGGWTNIEPRRYDGAHDISSLGGAPGPAATNSQLWGEVRHQVGETALALGATRYLYPDVGDLAATYATTELYASASGETLLGAPLAPALSVSYDVQKVRGAYVEGAVSGDVALAHRPVTLSMAVGYSAGQGTDRRGVQAAYFAGDGFTHAELAASTSVGLGDVRLVPAAHLVIGRDAAVRVTAADRSRVAKGWLGMTLTWAR